MLFCFGAQQHRKRNAFVVLEGKNTNKSTILCNLSFRRKTRSNGDTGEYIFYAVWLSNGPYSDTFTTSCLKHSLFVEPSCSSTTVITLPSQFTTTLTYANSLGDNTVQLPSPTDSDGCNSYEYDVDLTGISLFSATMATDLTDSSLANLAVTFLTDFEKTTLSLPITLSVKDMNGAVGK